MLNTYPYWEAANLMFKIGAKVRRTHPSLSRKTPPYYSLAVPYLKVPSNFSVTAHLASPATHPPNRHLSDIYSDPTRSNPPINRSLIAYAQELNSFTFLIGKYQCMRAWNLLIVTLKIQIYLLILWKIKTNFIESPEWVWSINSTYQNFKKGGKVTSFIFSTV